MLDFDGELGKGSRRRGGTCIIEGPRIKAEKEAYNRRGDKGYRKVKAYQCVLEKRRKGIHHDSVIVDDQTVKLSGLPLYII